MATSISDQFRTSLRPKLRRFYDVFATSLCRLGCEGKVWKISNAAKIDNTGCTFSTKVPKIMLLPLNFFILFCVNKMVEFFKRCFPSQIVRKPESFYGKTTNFQNWGHPLKTYLKMVDFTTTTPTPYRHNRQNLGYLLSHCES